MIQYRRVQDTGFANGTRYAVYRNGQRIGFARQSENHVWYYSVDGVLWSSTSPNRRTEAANQLCAYHGFEPAATYPNRTARRAGGNGRGRAFGVEMELTGPSGSLIEAALRAHGINVNYHGQYRATNGSQWELKHDGSVSGHGLELVSPKLRGAAGFAELETVCRALAEAGATVDRSCGLHVHHDMRGLTAAQIKRQVLAFVDRQTLVARMVAPSRRSGHTYCPTWTDSHRSALARFVETSNLRDIAYIGPRGSINLQAYARHGSVEIRYHGGTTNFRKIAAWVRFGQSLFAAAEAQVTVSTVTVEAMLRDLIAAPQSNLTAEDAATLLRFERFGESRTAVAAAIAEATEMMAEVS